MFTDDILFQETLIGRLKPTSVGTEVIHFNIPLGFITAIVVINIPEEGRTEAPVYIKFKRTVDRARAGYDRPVRDIRATRDTRDTRDVRDDDEDIEDRG